MHSWFNILLDCFKQCPSFSDSFRILEHKNARCSIKYKHYVPQHVLFLEQLSLVKSVR